MAWNEVAFSYKQIEDFLSIVALAHYEARKLLPFGSVPYKCFCTGFYFFAWGIKEELAPAVAEELLNLAVRVEALALHPSDAIWDQNAGEARRLLTRYFEGDRKHPRQ